MIYTIRVTLDHPTLAGSPGIISQHDDLASAVTEAYMRRDTHTVYLAKQLGVLNRSVKGAASTWDALARADEEEAARKETEHQERALLAALKAKYESGGVA